MCKLCSELPGCIWHRVSAGESLADIAARYGTRPARLLDLNPYVDPAELIEGMPLFVPCVSQGCAHARYGELRDRLSARLGADEAALAARNPLLLPGPLLPGQRIRL